MSLAYIQKYINKICWCGCGEKVPYSIGSKNRHYGSEYGGCWFNWNLPRDPASPLLGIYANKMESTWENDLHFIYIEAQTTIPKRQPQPRYPSNEQQMKKRWYTYLMQYYSDIKKNETLQFETKLFQLETVMFNEISQSRKDKQHVFSMTYDNSHAKYKQNYK